jgi:spermidine synthase
MGGTSSVRSDYRQAWLPLLLHPAPRSALFLGIGTGATLVGGSLMPGVAVSGIELLAEVTELLPWFSDPAVRGRPPQVRVADARRYVAADRGQYDVIIADLFHPALDGSGALYTPEHFAAVRARLAPGGLFCQWLALYQLDAPSLRAIIRGFLDIYPDGSAWLAHFSVRTPMLALCGGRTPVIIDSARMAERLREPALKAVAAPVGFENPLDVLGQFVAGAGALRRLAGEGPRNTDDYPFVALDAARNVRALTAPPASLLLTVIGGVQPDPSTPLADPSLAPRLTAFWRARDRFIKAGAELQGEPRGLALIDAASPGLLEAVRLSADFNLAYVPLLSMAQALLQSDRGAGLRLLRSIIDAAPARPEARALLARLEER